MRRPDQHKVIIHHIVSPHGKAVGNELILTTAAMHQQHITITVHGVLDGGTGTDRHDMRRDAGISLDHGQDMVIETGVFG